MLNAAVFLLNAKLVLHPKDVPIVHGEDVAVGIQRNARITLSSSDSLTLTTPLFWRS